MSGTVIYVGTQSVDARTGERYGPILEDTGKAKLDEIMSTAVAARAWGAIPRAIRADILRALADRLETAGRALISLADRETGLGSSRLTHELARTTFQIRCFADLLLDGAYLRVMADPADDRREPAGHPDLRRTMVPLGPVAVFGASNFPFAFGVSGGDTASALAAGCPVVVKAHPAHPQLSEAIAIVVGAALGESGAPPGTFALVRGMDAGRWLVSDARTAAVAFTGSAASGRALFDLAVSRPEPIPFYGELGSVNPVFVTPRGAERGEALVTAYLDSLTLSNGQLCTKPGLLVVPRAAGLLGLIAGAVAQRSVGVFLTAEVASRYEARLGELRAIHGATMLAAPGVVGSAGDRVHPAIVQLSAADALVEIDAVQSECFGPAGVIIEYDDDRQATALADRLHGCLVGTVHGHANEPLARELLASLTRISGRVVWNGWPTGVAVSPAQHHGGPFPATTSALHTSVGAGAIDRFLRPVVFQSVPQELLPVELRDLERPN